ncbi:MAG: hypothetical protein M1820_007362 [Bogoriella megaspora]|nr:MAG: hypothetical protein M1820_007362 [Bogoriella megaspora]
MNPPHKSRNFFDLPIELRIKIYSYVLSLGSEKYFDFRESEESFVFNREAQNRRLVHSNVKLPLAFSYVDKEVRYQTLPLIYGEDKIFRFHNEEHLITWLQMIGDGCKFVRNIEVALVDGPMNGVSKVFWWLDDCIRLSSLRLIDLYLNVPCSLQKTKGQVLKEVAAAFVKHLWPWLEGFGRGEDGVTNDQYPGLDIISFEQSPAIEALHLGDDWAAVEAMLKREMQLELDSRRARK